MGLSVSWKGGILCKNILESIDLVSFVLVATGQSHVLLRSLGFESRDGQPTTTGPLGVLVLPSDMFAARASSLVGEKREVVKD